MNYISEILCFQNYNRNQSLSAGQISLWYALFAASNRQGLGKPFSISDKALELDAGLGPTRLKEAKKTLCNLGLLTYTVPVKRGERGVYHLTCMADLMNRSQGERPSEGKIFLPESKSDQIPDSNTDVKSDLKSDLKTDGKSGSYNNKYKTKQKTKQEKKKKAFGLFHNVWLSEQEYCSLKTKFPDLDDRIKQMSMYLASSGKTYSSYYAALLQWAQRDQKANSSLTEQESLRCLEKTIANANLRNFRGDGA